MRALLRRFTYRWETPSSESTLPFGILVLKRQIIYQKVRLQLPLTKALSNKELVLLVEFSLQVLSLNILLFGTCGWSGLFLLAFPSYSALLLSVS
jgi:hypothetical protein